jgi:hypothetical protein
MTISGIVALVIWVFMAFWMGWYVNVQLDRLHRNTFNKSRQVIFARLHSSSGVLRLIGIVLYSPYIFPLRAVAIWRVAVFCLYYFTGGNNGLRS